MREQTKKIIERAVAAGVLCIDAHPQDPVWGELRCAANKRSPKVSTAYEQLWGVTENGDTWYIMVFADDGADTL